MCDYELKVIRQYFYESKSKRVDVCGAVQVQFLGLLRIDKPILEVVVTNE